MYSCRPRPSSYNEGGLLWVFYYCAVVILLPGSHLECYAFVLLSPPSSSHLLLIEQQRTNRGGGHRNDGASFDRSSSTRLEAKAKTKKNNKRTSSVGTGFGGAAVAKCPCGKDLSYMKCCGILHTDENALREASAEQIVRARYSAYSKKLVDFIMKTTHPDNKNCYMSDATKWKQDITENCYNEFDLSQCVIVDEEYSNDNDIATVKFIARLIDKQTRDKSAFMETSQFKRMNDDSSTDSTNGWWLYLSGEVEQVDAVDIKTS